MSEKVSSPIGYRTLYAYELGVHGQRHERLQTQTDYLAASVGSHPAGIGYTTLWGRAINDHSSWPCEIIARYKVVDRLPFTSVRLSDKRRRACERVHVYPARTLTCPPVVSDSPPANRWRLLSRYIHIIYFSPCRLKKSSSVVLVNAQLAFGTDRIIASAGTTVHVRWLVSINQQVLVVLVQLVKTSVISRSNTAPQSLTKLLPCPRPVWLCDPTLSCATNNCVKHWT